MHNLSGAMHHLSSQLGWLSEVLGPDFWAQIQEACQAGNSLPARPGWPAAPSPGIPAAFPPMEAYATSTEVVCYAALPGLTAPEQVSVSQTGPTEMLLEGYIPPGEFQGAFLQRERFTGYWSRSVTLPVPVRPEGVRARYADGVLEFRCPRLEPPGAHGGVPVLQVRPE